MFRSAKRSEAKLRLALCGPAGAGKTYSALCIAKGLGGRIGLIDTERGSSELYAALCDFDVAVLAPPFTPRAYVEAIQAAGSEGYDVLIIDSLSHAWAGPGGVLEMHDNAARTMKNSFAAWREVTPEHNRLVDAILESGCHVIATMRTKTAYEVVKGDNGKAKVAKVGLAPVQRDGVEYEFTVVLDMTVEGHLASVGKDRTGLFDGTRFVPDEAVGQRLAMWQAGPCGVDVGSVGTGAVELERALEGLRLGHLWVSYKDYVLGRYGIRELGELGFGEIQEQLVMLGQCRERPEKLARFEEMLRGKAAA